MRAGLKSRNCRIAAWAMGLAVAGATPTGAGAEAAAADAAGGLSEARAEVRVALPRERCWELLRDLSVAHRYVPGIVATEITTEQREGVGTSRRVTDSRGRGMDETVVEWTPGRGLLLRLHRGEAGPPAPFARASFRYALEDDGPAATRAVLTLAYQPRWGLAGRALDALLMRRLVRGRIRAVAAGLGRYWEGAAAP